MTQKMMERLTAIVILIFGNIIVAALLPAVEQPMRTIFYIGLGIADVLALIRIIAGSFPIKKT